MQDIKHTANGDIDLSTGDIVYAESTQQHQKDILLARKGDYRQSPDVGVGLEDYLDDDNKDGLLAELRRQLAKDGMNVKRISVDGYIVNIDAVYK